MTREPNPIDFRIARASRLQPSMVATVLACLASLSLSLPASAELLSGRWLADGNRVVEASGADLDRRMIKRIDPNTRMELAGSKHGCTVYLDPNGSGQRWDAFVNIPRVIATRRSYNKLYNASSAWDRRISSLRCEASSRVDCTVAVYSGTNRSGDNAMLYGRMGLVNLSQFGWDDRIRSLEVFCSRK